MTLRVFITLSTFPHQHAANLLQIPRYQKLSDAYPKLHAFHLPDTRRRGSFTRLKGITCGGGEAILLLDGGTDGEATGHS